MAINEKVSNNITNYNVESNYSSYYRRFRSNTFNQNILGIAELPRTLPVSELDRKWMITKAYHYRLDRISKRWYGSDYLDFMWVLMLYNKPLDNETAENEGRQINKVILPGDERPESKPGVNPFKDFPAGREIYIPDRSTIQNRLI